MPSILTFDAQLDSSRMPEEPQRPTNTNPHREALRRLESLSSACLEPERQYGGSGSLLHGGRKKGSTLRRRRRSNCCHTSNAG